MLVGKLIFKSALGMDSMKKTGENKKMEGANVWNFRLPIFRVDLIMRE